MKIVLAEEIVINIEKGLEKYPPRPKSLTLTKSVQMPAKTWTVCCHDGMTYVGMDNDCLARIDSDYEVKEKFICFSQTVESVAVYKEVIYLLGSGFPSLVASFDLSGEPLNQWEHVDTTCHYSNMLVVASDRVLIPDTRNLSIIAYSLTGEVMEHISCDLFDHGIVGACPVDDASVIICDNSSSRVFRLNATTGEVMWICEDVRNPAAVGCLKERYIFVTTTDDSTIHILDAYR